MGKQVKRDAELTVAVGKKKVGKTYSTRQLIEDYLHVRPKKKVLIFDVNGEYEGTDNDTFPPIKALSINDVKRFVLHPKVEARRIRPLDEETGLPLNIKQMNDVLTRICYEFKNGLLLIEDPNRYLGDNLPQDLVGTLCTMRHSGVDVVMHFQGIGRIVPKIWQNMNWLRYHKNNEGAKRHKNKFPDKYELLMVAENIVNGKYKTNPHYYLYVSIDEEKIAGDFTPKDFAEAVRQLSITDSKLIKPYEKAHKKDALTAMVKDYMEKYYGNSYF